MQEINHKALAAAMRVAAMKQLDTSEEVVDLFSGFGGFGFAAVATKLKLTAALNHNQLAVDYHALNFPGIEHYCQDARQFDFGQIPGTPWLVTAGPSCKRHTKASGKARKSYDPMRASAFAVVDCLDAKRPEFGLVENVPEFMQWTLYPAWKLACELLGYSVSPHIVDSADFGVPQNRVRAFIVLSRSKHPLKLNTPKRPHLSAESFLELEDEHDDWRPWDPDERQALGLRPFVDRTMRSIAHGRRQHGDTFVTPYYSSGSGEQGRSIKRPIGTISTVDGWRVVRGNRTRMLRISEYRNAMAVPDDAIHPTTKADACLLFGNAVTPPVPAWFMRQLQSH